jgi:acetyl-CoA acetyltransferase
VMTDNGLMETTLDGLASPKPSGRPEGVHTTGSSSQISDGASGALLMSGQKARDLGPKPLASIEDIVLVGCDPVLMLEGSILATRTPLLRNGMTMSNIYLFEIN